MFGVHLLTRFLKACKQLRIRLAQRRVGEVALTLTSEILLYCLFVLQVIGDRAVHLPQPKSRKGVGDFFRRCAFLEVNHHRVCLLYTSLESVILRGLHVFPDIMSSFAATLFFLLVIGYHQSILTYWSILGAQCTYGWYRRYEERRQEALRLELRSSQLERQLAEAHLSALKMQLHPHFLFNTLNTIMVLVRQQKGREAEEMLARLSDLLRCVLDDVQAQEVPLSRELEYLQLYLSIEQVRFQDRLRVDIAADPEVLDAALPHMALQPIVENAIRHGIGRSSTAGQIGITACRVNESVEIKIRDDGPGLAAANGTTGGGIGLANTRARLRELYGDAASLKVENAERGGVVATMVLPFRAVLEAHAAHGSAG